MEESCRGTSSWAKKDHLTRLSESQGRNLAVTVLHVPSPLDSGGPEWKKAVEVPLLHLRLPNAKYSL